MDSVLDTYLFLKSLRILQKRQFLIMNAIFSSKIGFVSENLKIHLLQDKLFSLEIGNTGHKQNREFNANVKNINMP